MIVTGFLCVFASISSVLLPCSVHGNNNFELKNDLLSLTGILLNDTETSSIIHDTEFVDPQKKIIAHKNEISGECVLKPINDQAEILNFINIYSSKMELSEDEMVEIIGENIKNFCDGKIIILNNIDDGRITRSKRSTDKKRYQGQTQTQFVSFGSKDSNQQTKNGLAEALSQPDLSRATVSGLNGMGQAQSQSSFGDCDECSGQDSRIYPTHADNSHIGHFPLSQPQSYIPPNKNTRPNGGPNTNGYSPGLQYDGSNIGPINGPYPGSGTNNGTPGKQDQGYVTGPSTNGQYPSTYPGSRINNKTPGKQDQGYDIGSSINGKYPGIYPGSGMTNRGPDNQNQGHVTKPFAEKQYPSSGTNNGTPDKQDQGYVTGPSINEQYPSTYPDSGTNNKTPSKQHQGYVTGPSINGQYPSTYPGSGTNNVIPGKQDQRYATGPSINGQYPNTYSGSGTNYGTPGKQDQGYDTSIGGQYPNIYPDSGTNNRMPDNQNQIYATGPLINEQYPLIHNKLPGNLDQGYISTNKQIPISVNLPESKKPGNTDNTNQNIYSVGSSSLNPSSWNNPNKVTYSDGSGFPSFPSGSAQGILAPHNTPNQNHERTYPRINQQIPTAIESLNKPTDFVPNQLNNYPYQAFNELDKFKPITKPTSGISNSQNSPITLNEAVDIPSIQNGYPLPWNIGGGQGITQVNLPSLCNYLYQTCLNALSNNKKIVELTTGQQNTVIPQQNNARNQFGNTRTPSIEQPSSPLYSGEINPNQIQPDYGHPQGSLGSGGSGLQQSGYPSSSGHLKPNQLQPNYYQSQDSLGTGASGVQQSGYPSSSGNIKPDQVQPGYGPPQGSLGAGGSGVQQSGYPSSIGNVNPNQMQPGYGQLQGSLGAGGSGVQQYGYPSSIGNVKPNQIYPQGSLGTGVSGIQQSGYPSSNGNVNPNQIHPQGSLGTGVSEIQQSGYPSSSGNVNPNQMQPGYGQPQGSLGAGGSGVQQSGYPSSIGNVNPNQMQPGYGQPQGSLGAGGSGVQQSGYPSSIGNVNPNQIHPQGSLSTEGSGIQQSGYPSSSGNLNPNQVHPSYGQHQGSIDAGGSDVQQSGYPSSSGNVNPNQINPQGSLGNGVSGIQQSRYPSSSGNLNPNQVHPSYGQHQGSIGAGGSDVQQSGYPSSIGNLNPNQVHPQSSLGTEGSGIQQSGYPSSSGNGNPNQIQPGYGQLQGSIGTGGSGVQQSGYPSSIGNVNPNQINPQDSLGNGVSGIQQSGYPSSSGNLNPNQVHPSYGQHQGSIGVGGSDVQQSGNPSSIGNLNPNQVHPQGSLGTEGSGIQQSGYPSFTGNVSPNLIQPGYRQPQGSLGAGGSVGQQSRYPSSNGNLNPNQVQPGFGQSQGSLGGGESSVQQFEYPSSSGNVNPNQMQPGYGQPQGSLGAGGSGVQQSGYPSVAGNVSPNLIQPGYKQPQGSLGAEGSGGQQPVYGVSGGSIYPNSPSNFQLGLDGKEVPGSNPQLYSDNYYRGPQFGPGNNYPSTNPIIDGQFGFDGSHGGSVTPIDTEGGDAQSLTNVNVDGKETSASASAQGKSRTGMTQTQVSGTYSGTGTFSAQAQTSDSDKGAQSHIVSNTNGTTSTAQGKGGKGQAQSQVLYNADSGIALGEAQSSGINYGTNTQLQAGIKGGVADAQSTGPGSTSSQAQIGFLPYESNNDTNQKSLFKGGGTASSQGGHYSGQSQSQLFGSYKYGISYNGAAQASSGKKLQNLPKLNLNDAKSKIEQLEGSNNELKSQTNALQLPAKSIPNQLQSQTPPKITNTNSTEQINSTLKPSILPLESYQSSLDADTEYDDNNDEYEDEKDEIVNTKSAQTKEETNPKQIQNIILNLDNKHDAQITRDSDSKLKSGQILDAGQIIPGTNGTKIPDGFRGRVASVAGDHTEAKAIPGGQAQTQTVLLTPGVGGLTLVDKTNLRALLNKESYIGPTNRSYNRFQTDTNGETGQFKPGDKNVQYFTKSSTCGYFSFSCNYVNGAQSGPKICKPNPPPIPCQRSN